MRQIKFRRKLYIGIALAVSLVLLLGVCSYLTGQKEREAEAWINHTMLVKAKLQEINLGIKENAAVMRARRRYRHTDTVLKGIDRSSVLYACRELQVLVADNADQEERSDRLRRNIFSLFSFWDKINPEETISDAVKEENYFRDEVRLIEASGSVIDEMDRREDQLLKERSTRTSNIRDINNLLNIGGTFFILLIVISLAVIISAEFGKRRRAELLLQEKMREQDRLHQETAQRNEVLSGAQAIMQAVQRATEVKTFMETIMEGILRFTALSSGIAYLADEATDKLIPVYYQGLPDGQVRETSLKQLLSVMPEGKASLAYTDNIPADFWQLESATGHKTPGLLIHMYLKLQDRLLGVLELASFQPLTFRQSAFLEMLPDGIAVRLAAVQLSDSRSQLVKKLQENRELLLNQQEELRQTNEELLNQANVLQSSEAELQAQEEELKQINAELEEKNEALEATRQVLASRATELELSGNYKSEFLANMSHELRTPLNSILILANLLKDNKQGNLTEKQTEYARIIGNSGADLLQLINDILDLSKIEAGKVELNIAAEPLERVAGRMKEVFQAQAEQKHIRLELECVQGTVTTDVQRLEQILKNLLSNAVKFTSDGGTVTLKIDMASGQRIRFRVSDTGIGIDPSKLELIFEAFRQEDGSTNRKYGGTGLGLSISRELARILKGSIEVESRQGEGSTFTLYLPEYIAAGAPAAVIPVSEPKTATQNTHPTDKTILIIEDDPTFAGILREFAEERHYRTLHAYDGRQGLEMAREFRPDAIILDMQMPVMDGGALLKQLKSDPELNAIPVHVISAMDAGKVPQQDVIAYMRKPVTHAELEDAFSRIAAFIGTGEENRLLIWSAASGSEDTLLKLTSSLPATMVYDHVSSREEIEEAGRLHHYDCLLVDVRALHEPYLTELSAIRDTTAFSGIPVILLIDQEISPADEMKLRSISEAIVMQSAEAHRRLKDELELFIHRIREHRPVQERVIPHFADDNVLAGKRILVADDDMRNVFALVGLLENQQMEVVTASNGKEAIKVLEEQEKVDVVLMDIMMPEMDGYETMHYLRSQQAFQGLPIIAVTAKAMAEDRELCIRSGASDYISKPVDNHKLLSLLRVWLS